VAASLEGAQRLVVHSYDTSPRAGGRPVGSVQRPVTREDLENGVSVDLLELRASDADFDATRYRVVAWLEPGEGDLAYDGRQARPRRASVTGTGRLSTGRLSVGDNPIRLALHPPRTA
jgi:hypothetical protein